MDPPREEEPIYKAGTIRSIKLINFMCHESFELSLGPRVNFVIGPNGSGKSALLTALVVALGGRATITSRARKTGDFVMYGKNAAKIIVVLHNYEKIMEKEQAFKPQDYGKRIVIEKVIYKDERSNKLILKNDKDKRISERKQELDDMLEHFGILINNPICILNQEISKNFLHSKKPEDKFDLFMKATTLEQIQNDYDEARESYQEWGECNSKKTIAFKLLDKEYSSCREKASFLDNRSRINVLQQELMIEWFWATYNEAIEEAKVIENKIKGINNAILDANKQIDSRKNKIKNCEEEIEIEEEKKKSIIEQIAETRNKLQDIVKKEMDVKIKRSELDQVIVKYERSLKRQNEDKKSLENSIAELRRQFNELNDIDNNNEQRKREIERLEKALEAEVAREKSTRTHIDHLSSSMTSVRSDLHNANLRVGDIKDKLNRSNATLSRIKASRGNALRKFGESAPRIREEIERNANKFKCKPIGPLGYFIKLKEPSNPHIPKVLEAHIGRSANSYLVDNATDSQTLSNICYRLGANNPTFQKPMIISRPFTRRHRSLFRAEHEIYLPLMDYLDIKNDVVYSTLLERNSLESVLFIPEYDEAERIMIDPNLVPKNTECAYTKDCTVMHPRKGDKAYKSFSIPQSQINRMILFSDDNSGQIQEAEREIAEYTTSLRDAEQVVNKINSSLITQRHEYDEANKEIRKIVEGIRKKEEQLLNLKTTITREPQELSALEEELDKLVGKIAEEKLKLEELQESRASVQKNYEDIIQEKDECKSIITLRETARQTSLKVIEKTKESINASHLKIKELHILLENRKKEIIQQTSTLEETHRKVEVAKLKLEDHERPAKVRSSAQVQVEQKKVDAQLRAHEELDQDPEELMRNIEKRMKEIEDLQSLGNSNSTNFEITKDQLESRKEGFKVLRQNTVTAVGATFSTVMRTMGMNGQLCINLDDTIYRGEVVKKAKTLDLRIDTNYTPSQRPMNDSNSTNSISGSQPTRRTSRSQPSLAPRAKRSRDDSHDNRANEKENNLKMTDARSLSGGERSFSTVAFVLALWHHCSSPFKLMDEIDVFMDMVTRRMSYNALIRFAQASEEPGQFIFFSPLELPKIDDSGTFVRVFEMPAIVRKQRPQTQIVSGDEANS